jgi:hypothetical protein
LQEQNGVLNYPKNLAVGENMRNNNEKKEAVVSSEDLKEFERNLKNYSVEKLGDMMCAGYKGEYFRAIVRERIRKKSYD